MSITAGRFAWAAVAVACATPAWAAYRLTLIGPENVAAGYDLYVQARAEFQGAPARLYLNKTTAPEGMKVSLQCSPYMPECVKDEKGRLFQYEGEDPVLVRIQVPGTMQPGTYEVVLATEAENQPAEIRIPVHVSAAPRPAPPPSLPDVKIPGLKNWHREMMDRAHQWCNPKHPNVQYGFGIESQAWYYDGARVYFQIADYTRDPAWEGCAFNVARQYRDYVITARGKIPGWRVFPHGLEMAYKRSHDESYRQAVMLLAQNTPYAATGGGVTDQLIRETAYISNAYMAAERLGAPRNPLLARSISYLLGHFDVIFVTGKYHYHQPFMDGLAAEALISYYELTNDPRILPAIEKMCDWIFNTGWRHHELPYNPDPPGPHCDEGCQHYQGDLINLIAPAFAWAWRQTGDPRYLKEGDDLFAHSLDVDIDYSGKIFSQNFRWSFQYVAWRSRGEAAR